MEFEENEYKMCSNCQDSVHNADVEICGECGRSFCPNCMAEYLSEWTIDSLCKECAEEETELTEDEREIIETSYYDIEVFEAARECDIPISDVDEAYFGEFIDDEEFVQELLTEVGDIPPDLPHYIHIDWERTARDIMHDYCEHNGLILG